jgi:hypothetical protein
MCGSDLTAGAQVCRLWAVTAADGMKILIGSSGEFSLGGGVRLASAFESLARYRETG